MNPTTLLFTESHEWIEPAGDERRVGISDHAQHMLGDIVFVDLPAVGKTVKQGEELLVVESPKAAASVYAPLSGTVVAVNDALAGAPETINRSSYDEGWLVKLKVSNAGAESGKLLSHDAYGKVVGA